MSRPIEACIAIAFCAAAISAGSILHAENLRVSAGRGSVIDWSTDDGGERILDAASPEDVAELFVDIVGVTAAVAALNALRRYEARRVSTPETPRPVDLRGLRVPIDRAAQAALIALLSGGVS